MFSILWLVFIALIAVWVLGLMFKIGGKLIHLALIIAAVVFIYNLMAHH